MPRVLSYFYPFFAPKFSFYTITACLVLLVLPMWGIAPTRFNGVAAALPTGSVTLTLPSDTAVDLSGNIFIADTGNSQIVKINPQGSASALTISGLTTALSFPTGIAVDGAGTLYVADSGNHRVVTITAAGVGAIVSTPSITLNSPQGVALDQSGNLFIADTGNNRIVEVSAAGAASVFAITGLGTALNTPTGLAINPAGNLYIADSVNSRIVKVAAGGMAGAALAISGLSTALDTPRGVDVDGLGNVYIADTNNNRIVVVTSAGAGSPLGTGSVTLSLPKGVAVGAFGTIYIADTSDNRAVTVGTTAVGFGHLQLGTTSGATQTLPFTVNISTTLGAVKAFTSGTENLDFTVGSGSTCTAGTTNTTCTVDIQFLPTAPGLRRGAVVLYDNGSPQAPVVTVPLYGFSDAPVAALAPNTASLINTGGVATYYPFQLALDGAGNMYVGNYVLSGTNPKVVKVPAGGGSASVISTPGFTLSAICGVALDGAGNLFIGDHANVRIIVVTPGGVASQLAISGLSPALGEPTELAFDAAGNLYIADYSPNARIVKVSSLAVAGSTSSGVGTVLATGSYSLTAGKLSGVAVGPDGTVYIASGTDNSSHVVQVTAAGVASLLNSSALSFLNPQGLTTDGMGNLYVADSNHNRIVEITTAGVASVVSVPGLTAPSTLSAIYGITADAAGNVYIPDWTNNRLVYLSVAGSSLSFANTKQGFTSTDSPKTATATNLGNQDLVFAADPTYTADFSQPTGSSSQCLSGTSLTPGTMCNVSVQFVPQSVGSLSAGVTLTNNTLNVASSTQQVSVSGTGLTPGDTTATALGTSASTVAIGESFTITATVTDTTAGHTSTVPTGGVTLTDTVGSTVLSLNSGAAVTLISGVATLSGVTLSASGAHTITANYQGVTGSFLASSNTAALAVAKDSASVSGPSTQPVTAAVGQAGSVSITVAGPYSAVPVPSGSVSYDLLDVSSASVASGTATLTAGTSNSTAVVPIPDTLSAGDYTASVSYGGDSNYAPSSTPTIVQVSVGRVLPTINWTQPAGITHGSNLSAILNATAVNGSASVAGGFAFTATLQGGSAVAVSSTTVLGAGSYTLTATFTPTDAVAYASATGSVSLTVAKATPAVTLTSSASTALVQGAITFTATVSSPASTPSGSVTFYDGTTLLGSGTLTQGAATYASSSLAVGSHPITAAYGGDSNFSSVTSSEVAQIVSDFTITVASGSSSTATVAAGGTATYSLTISPSAGTTFPAAAALTTAGAPTGSIVTITPSTLPAGDGVTNVTVAISVPATAAAMYRLGEVVLAPIMAGMFLLPWGGRLRRRLGSRGLMVCGMFFVLLATGSLSGCASESPAPAAPASRSYTITLTATSGTVTNSTTLHLTVQ